MTTPLLLLNTLETPDLLKVLPMLKLTDGAVNVPVPERVYVPLTVILPPEAVKVPADWLKLDTVMVLVVPAWKVPPVWV